MVRRRVAAWYTAPNRIRGGNRWLIRSAFGVDPRQVEQLLHELDGRRRVPAGPPFDRLTAALALHMEFEVAHVFGDEAVEGRAAEVAKGSASCSQLVSEPGIRCRRRHGGGRHQAPRRGRRGRGLPGNAPRPRCWAAAQLSRQLVESKREAGLLADSLDHHQDDLVDIATELGLDGSRR